MDGTACIYGGESSSIQHLPHPSTCLHTSQNNQPANKKPNAYTLEMNKENIKACCSLQIYSIRMESPAPPEISLFAGKHNLVLCVCVS